MIEVLRNVFYKVRLFFANLFEKDVVIKIGSLIAAILIWFIISVTATLSLIPISEPTRRLGIGFGGLGV